MVLKQSSYIYIYIYIHDSNDSHTCGAILFISIHRNIGLLDLPSYSRISTYLFNIDSNMKNALASEPRLKRNAVEYTSACHRILFTKKSVALCGKVFLVQGSGHRPHAPAWLYVVLISHVKAPYVYIHG